MSQPPDVGLGAETTDRSLLARIESLEARVGAIEGVGRFAVSDEAKAAIRGDWRWMPVSDFAKLTRKPDVTIRRWCVEGRLPASKRGGAYWSIDFPKLKSMFKNGVKDLVIDASTFAAMARSP